MDGKTMRALMEHMVEQHRKERERNSKSGYETIYVKEEKQQQNKDNK
jgi:hypothetical protein